MSGGLSSSSPISVDSLTSTTVVKSNNQTTMTQTSNTWYITNPLNQYANYTYHVALVMSTETDAYAINSLNDYKTINKLIIASSGSFGSTIGNNSTANQAREDLMPMNIIDTVIENTVGPGPRNQNSMAYSWNMTIVEPYGLTLPERIYLLSQDLQIKNWLQLPLFLEISFRGYDENGNTLDDLGITQIYRVLIADINCKVTTAGSEYSISGVMDNMIAQSNKAAIAPGTVEIWANTIGSFFSQLKTYLNKQQERSSKGGPPEIVYDFLIDPKYINMKLVDPNNNLGNDHSNAPFGVNTNGVPIPKDAIAIKMSTATDINKVVDDVMSLSPEAKKLLTGLNEPLSSGNTSTTTNNWATAYPMVNTISELIEGNSYDPPRNSYRWKITYCIVHFNKNSNIVTGENQVQQKVQDTNGYSQALQNLVSQNKLIKQYNYIFTGRNTEVINFDINLNNWWSVMISQFASNTWHQYVQGATAASNSVGADSVTAKGNSPLTQTASVAPNPINVDNVSQTTTASNQTTTSSNQLLVATTTLNTPTGHASMATNAKDPKTIINNPQGGGDSPGSVAFSNLSSSIYNPANFVSCELEIRGDPYWLGNGNVIDGVNMKNILMSVDKTSTTSTYNSSNTVIQTNQFADYIFGENLFEFNYRTGSVPDENTGLVSFTSNISTSRTFSGQYTVYHVTNSFKQGQFTQILKAYKCVTNPTINVQDAVNSNNSVINLETSKVQTTITPFENGVSTVVNTVKQNIVQPVTNAVNNISKFLGL